MGKIIYNGDVFGGAMTNMRYNPETDMVEIYYNGVWNEWKSGNMQTIYLYRDGEQVVPLDNSGSYYHSSSFPHRGYAVLDEDKITISYTNTNYGVYPIGLASMYDFTGYTKVCVEVDYAGVTQVYEISTNSCGFAYFNACILRNDDGYTFRMVLSSTKEAYSTSQYASWISPAGTSAEYKNAIIRKIWVE